MLTKNSLLRLIKLLAIAFLGVQPEAAYCEEKTFTPVPGLVHLEGVGAIYGVGAISKGYFDSETEISAGAVAGSVQGAGFLISGHPELTQDLKVSLGFLEVLKAEFENSYVRGLKEGHRVKQVLSGRGAILSLQYKTSDWWQLSSSLSNSWVKFEDYKTLDGSLIPFDKTSLHDINSIFLSLGGNLKIWQSQKSQEDHLQLNLGLTMTRGRFAQSDIDTWSLGIKSKHTFAANGALKFIAKTDRTFVSKEAQSSAVNGDCNAISDENIRSDCQKLQAELTEYVAASNKQGTAPPLGGSRGLRSFRELRFRGAHTALTGVEVGWNLRASDRYKVQAISFFEAGFVADVWNDLFQQNRTSYGFGLHIILNKLPIRLETAHGAEGWASFLTAGNSW